jgi:hypothetical protein
MDGKRKEEEEKRHTSPNRDYKPQPRRIISPYQTRHLPLSIDGVRGRRINMLDHYYQYFIFLFILFGFSFLTP